MTPYGLIASALWAAVAFYGLHRGFSLVARRVPSVKVDEKPVPLPPDLQAYVANFSSDWARADAEKAARERFERHRDWNLVRRDLGLGVM